MPTKPPTVNDITRTISKGELKREHRKLHLPVKRKRQLSNPTNVSILFQAELSPAYFQTTRKKSLSGNQTKMRKFCISKQTSEKDQVDEKTQLAFCFQVRKGSPDPKAGRAKVIKQGHTLSNYLRLPKRIWDKDIEKQQQQQNKEARTQLLSFNFQFDT